MIVAQATGGAHYSNPSAAIISNSFSSSTASAAAAAPQEGFFIFPESEFEGELFHTPSLITKYRKVVSLEALREQLLAYSGALKQQLYTIINRDYKDFITISTKVAMIIMVIVLMMKIMIDDDDIDDTAAAAADDDNDDDDDDDNYD
jgi:hypothetical protein